MKGREEADDGSREAKRRRWRTGEHRERRVKGEGARGAHRERERVRGRGRARGGGAPCMLIPPLSAY